MNVVHRAKPFVPYSVVINNSTFFFAVIYASTSYVGRKDLFAGSHFFTGSS